MKFEIDKKGGCAYLMIEDKAIHLAQYSADFENGTLVIDFDKGKFGRRVAGIEWIEFERRPRK